MAQRRSRGSKRPKENQDTQKWLKEAYKGQADTKRLKVQIDFTDSKETKNAKTGNKRQTFCHSMGKLNLLNHQMDNAKDLTQIEWSTKTQQKQSA